MVLQDYQKIISLAITLLDDYGEYAEGETFDRQLELGDHRSLITLRTSKDTADPQWLEIHINGDVAFTAEIDQEGGSSNFEVEDPSATFTNASTGLKTESSKINTLILRLEAWENRS